MVVLRPLEFANLLSKNANEAMYLVWSALQVYFDREGPSYTRYSMLFSSLKCGKIEKHFGLYLDGLHTHNECCTIAVLFFVFGEVMLSIKAAISPSLYAATDNRTSSAAKLCLAAFFSFFPVAFHFFRTFFYLFGQSCTLFLGPYTARKGLEMRLKGQYCFVVAPV